MRRVRSRERPHPQAALAREDARHRRRPVVMHPALLQEIARHRQADLLREAEHARLARAAIVWGEEPPRVVTRRRRVLSALRPLLSG